MMCREVQRSLGPFLRRELPFDERLELQRHLAVCRRCAAAVEAARDAMDLSRCACAAARDPSPSDVPESLLAAIWSSSQ